MLNEKNKQITISNKIINNFDINNTNTDNNINNTKSLSQITREIYYFKNEMLKELNKIEQRINSKINLSSLEITNNKNDNESQLKLLSAKIDILSEKNIEYESFKEKMDDLMQYKIKNEETILINNIKLDDIKREIKNNFIKYDKIIKKHLIINGIVGENCQFKTNSEMIRYILDNISLFNNFRDKNILDLKSYKTKLESLIFGFKTQINNIIKSMTDFTTKSINESEERINGIFNLYNDRLVEIRMQNSNYIKNIIDRNEALMKEWRTIGDIRKNIEKVDTDILNIQNSIDNNYKEFKDELNEYNLKYLDLKSDFENLKNKRERQMIYSKKISLKQPKRGLGEDYLFKNTKINRRFSVSLENKNSDKWKKFIQNNFNKVIQKNNYNSSNESNIYSIDINNNNNIRKTLPYGGFRLKNHNNNNSNKENKLLNIHEYFESINEEENEINNNNLIYSIKENKNNENDNSELLSNKTITDENENKEEYEDAKIINENITNNIEHIAKNDNNDNNKINSKQITIKKNYENTKNKTIDNKLSKISNIKIIKSISSFENKSIQNINKYKDNSIKNNEIKLTDNINSKDKIANNILVKNNTPLNKEKDIINNLIISKEIHSSEIENKLNKDLPKIDDKRYITTFHEPEENIIKRINKKYQTCKKNKNFSSSFNPSEIMNLKKIKKYSKIVNHIEDNNLLSYRQKSKSINNIYYSKFAEKLKEKKILNIKKNKDSISTHEIMFDPFKNINAKLYTKNCPKENLIDNSLTNSNNISFNKTNYVNNNHAYSANKKKEDNVNSTSEYNHIIYIPPPSDSINKSLLGIS